MLLFCEGFLFKCIKMWRALVILMLGFLVLGHYCLWVMTVYELRLWFTSLCMETCVTVISETWLESITPDAAKDPSGLAAFGAGRSFLGQQRSVEEAYAFLRNTTVVPTLQSKTLLSGHKVSDHAIYLYLPREIQLVLIMTIRVLP